MKPKNEREREVTRLARRLPGLSSSQVRWVKDSVIEWHINCSGKRCWCEKCGHAFTQKPESNNLICPNCGTSLPIMMNRKRVVKGCDYIQIITTKGDWQVIRYIFVKWEGSIGNRPLFHFQEVIQKWCQPGRATITRGMALGMMPYWRTVPYSEYSNLSIKNPSYFYTEWMRLKVYPKMVLFKPYREAVKKSANFSLICAEDLLAIIYSIPYFETLYKAGKAKELKDAMDHYFSFQKYWPSVKVALRHGFKPKYWGDYFDYLRMLKYLRKDMHSPHYVAPEDYAGMHTAVLQQYQRKVDECNRRRQEAEAIRNAKAEEERMRREKEALKTFDERMARFSGLDIVADGIEIKPLMTIREFADEGNAMHHCVFALGYYKRPDSLILSARDKEGKRIETIEVGLSEGVVKQSRGPCNSITEHHDEIIALVNNNMSAIQKMAAS